ncbi:uncharacterized protein K489DRAFT_382368 [Dissoconium aciculare CBS 342.82]|uniref:Cyclin domain-containing protein n=1 Tax=Dissoconium aciculare CBS 342.82 TaxID=1314786 RepID=A0A6J3M063_9PEZI|nr:uncharacterized protein K489DRAFT_382368 [Dissoconium aciculare CBS 342.82]KAF1821318.1 hypothetical protein K489DRAFT_382368 [Dissoconium aciculare CBS 342.82]
MAVLKSSSSILCNQLVAASQLETSSSQLDGVPPSLEDAIRFHSAHLLQAAGILLRLPQDLIAQAIVLLFRYWTGPDGGSMLDSDAKDVAAAALFLTAKPTGHAVSPRQVLIVFEFLTRLPAAQRTAAASSSHATKLDDESRLPTDISWSLPEPDFLAARARLYHHESRILQTLAFSTHVALPHGLCINYLQTLDVFAPSSALGASSGASLARQALANLNTALLSPQMLYLTHQPNALATAAIYLAARQVSVNLPEVEWWEVFDVEREELGFLVVAMQSTVKYAEEEIKKLAQGAESEWSLLLTAKGVRTCMQKANE